MKAYKKRVLYSHNRSSRNRHWFVLSTITILSEWLHCK